MWDLIQPSVFLRRVLLADALVSAAVGAVMVLGAASLQRVLGLPTSLLVTAGLALIPYVAYVLWLAQRATMPRAAVWLPIALNIVWAAECVSVLAEAAAQPTPLGEAFIALQIVTVLLFAELEYLGLRRACAIVAA
jgi:hypothetical protein